LLESTLFSPGARGGGGGGGALGTNEGNGGGAGTVTIKYGMHPSGWRLFSAGWWGEHSVLQVVQVGPRFWSLGIRANRWALRALAVIKYNFNLMSLQFVSVVCCSFGSRGVPYSTP